MKEVQKEEAKEKTSVSTVTSVIPSAGMDDDTIEIDLKELFYMLLGHWKAIFMALLVGIAAAGAFHTFFVTPAYQAKAIIYITNTDSVISLSDLQLSASLTEDYGIVIKSRPVLTQVIEELGLEMEFEDLDELVTVTNPDSSHMIEIAVTSDDVEMSRNIVNSLLNISIQQIYQVIGTGEPTIVDYSVAKAVKDVTPSLMRYMLIGGLLGVLLICVVLVVHMLMNTKIETTEDVEKYLGIPVLAAVPYYKNHK
ncbi:MAG: Wzz/FepE/Etk N-terminal domain-containing protein [Lachnospiraceae bacterium]|nr:Wzz/FepE/Etk N-terminal domain-containing protein [Lachnospiraceae bacterium]